MKQIVINTLIGLVLIAVAYTLFGSQIKQFLHPKEEIKSAPAMSSSAEQQARIANEQIKVDLRQLQNKTVNAIVGCMNTSNGCHCYAQDGKK